MPDYIYLLKNRLSTDQRHALTQLRTAAHDAGFILFLTGDAVRDLTSGHAVRELEVAVHGNALKLRKPLEKLGAKLWGEDEASRSLYLCFPGTVRVNVVTTHRAEFPKPGKPVFHWASIHDDLRRRDFTINAMAISLNEGSYGLLMDPLNGAADIESRSLRLVSNYGFLQEPSLLIRATRYRARLGWDLDPRTQSRYEDAKNEGVIEFLSAHDRSQELEQIGHEEEGLKVLRALEAEGWMKVLFPAWTGAKADEAKLNNLHELAMQFLEQGVHPDLSAAQMQLLTAKMQSKDLAALKRAMLRPGFVDEWNHLDTLAAGFAKALLSKQNAKASDSYKLFMSYDPEAILWLAFTSKDKAVQERINRFLKVWPEKRQQIPYALMLEMRITPDLPGYIELLDQIFLQLIDGRLTTPEEMRAFLAPHSPPAPAPQPTYKRPRGRRAEARLREPEPDDDEESEDRPVADDDAEPGDDDLDPRILVKGNLDREIEEEEDEEEEEEEQAAEPVRTGKGKDRASAPIAKVAGKVVKAALEAKTAPAGKKPSPHPPQNGKPAAAPAKAAQQKPQPAQAGKAKPVPAKAGGPGKPAAKKSAPAKSVAPAKTAPKKPAKPAAKPARPVKAAAKPSKKSAKKR
jgi:tRNA nucleotidyltransferase (CCA-adding enzyme)